MVIVFKIVPRGTISDRIFGFLEYLFHVEQIFSKIEYINVPRGTVEISIRIKERRILDGAICFNKAVVINF